MSDYQLEVLRKKHLTLYDQRLARHECHTLFKYSRMQISTLNPIVPANWIESHIQSKKIRSVCFYKAIFPCFQDQPDIGHSIVHLENEIHYWCRMNQFHSVHTKFTQRNSRGNIFAPPRMEICFNTLSPILAQYHNFLH